MKLNTQRGHRAILMIETRLPIYVPNQVLTSVDRAPAYFECLAGLDDRVLSDTGEPNWKMLNK